MTLGSPFRDDDSSSRIVCYFAENAVDGWNQGDFVHITGRIKRIEADENIKSFLEHCEVVRHVGKPEAGQAPAQ